MFEDHGSTRIDLACPHCRQMFKVRLRKLQFGAYLICRLCRYEFSARDVSDRPEIQDALRRMHRIVHQRTQQARSCQPSGVAAISPAQQSNLLEIQGGELRPLITQWRGEQGFSDVLAGTVRTIPAPAISGDLVPALSRSP